jgi:hypothetical protein
VGIHIDNKYHIIDTYRVSFQILTTASRIVIMPNFDDYVVFVDESGDHGMVSIDPDYPMFVLAFCVFEKTQYAECVVPEVLKFKFRHFGHEQVILHEHDIRKAKGPFNILQNPSKRELFLTDMNSLIETCQFVLIASAIRKDKLQAQYVIPENPYHVAMGFGLERIFLHLHGLGCRKGTTYLQFESRGKKEDIELELEFRRVCDKNATKYRLPFEILLVDKKSNSPGLQIADLIARPIGRKILKPDQPNRAYEILHKKFRRDESKRIRGWGLKVFP